MSSAVQSLAAPERPASSETLLWQAVDSLIDRSPGLHDLRAHGLHLLAARRWRAQGVPMPSTLAAEERVAAVVSLLVRPLLERVVPSVDGPIVVLKGPEVAHRYPSPHLRPYGDLDLLVADAPAAHRALLAVGFAPVGDPNLYIDIHHERPLVWPGVPLVIELHSRPKWIDWVSAPPVADLLEAAVGSAVGVKGVSTLHPAHHALVTAVHSWAHTPLRRLGEIVDVALLADAVDRSELRRQAEQWGIARLWRTTERVADELLAGGHAAWPLRVWGRNLLRVRERTVLENHLAAWLSGFSAQSFGGAVAAMTGQIVDDLRPAAEETWRSKGRRTLQAVGRSSVRLSQHHDELGDEAFKLRRAPRPAVRGK
jgi:hypothetical protein